MATSPIDTLKESHPEAFRENSKYAPKMTFTERCEALGLYKQGVAKPIIAACYGINVSTLSYIVQAHSKLYRNVRREYNDLGHDAFVERYITQAVVERVQKAAHDWKATIPAKDYDEVKKKFDQVDRADPRARRMEGRHTMLQLGQGTLYAIVTYIDAELPPMPEIGYDEARPAGWYVYVDPKSPAYDPAMGEGPHGYPDARRTSFDAYNAFAALIGHDLKQVQD